MYNFRTKPGPFYVGNLCSCYPEIMSNTTKLKFAWFTSARGVYQIWSKLWILFFKIYHMKLFISYYVILFSRELWRLTLHLVYRYHFHWKTTPCRNSLIFYIQIILVRFFFVYFNTTTVYMCVEFPCLILISVFINLLFQNKQNRRFFSQVSIKEIY